MKLICVIKSVCTEFKVHILASIFIGTNVVNVIDSFVFMTSCNDVLPHLLRCSTWNALSVDKVLGTSTFLFQGQNILSTTYLSGCDGFLSV